MKPSIENYKPRFCNDEKDLYTVAKNNPFRKMVGDANPKTYRVPIVENRPMDLDVWKDDDRTHHSRTNNPGAPDFYLSGYTTYNGYPVNCAKNPPALYPRYDTVKEHFVYQTPLGVEGGLKLPPRKEQRLQYVIEPLEIDQRSKLNGCQAQINVNLPTNVPFSECTSDPRMSTYNQQVFTQNIGPNALTQSEVIEPINSNYGITEPIQLRPTVMLDEPTGHKYIELDPDIPREVEFEPAVNQFEPRYDNVYDPRSSGYGTSYRSYIEPVTGQPRFFYDDINALRMPNYITRSKIDFLNYADSYGEQKEAPLELNGMVQADWLNNTNQFREDLMRSLMRKRNSEMWQLRVAPHGPRRV